MFGALSTSQWKWTWRFLLLACVSAVVFALGAFLSSLSSTGEVGILFFLGLLCVAGLGVGIIGAVVSFVTIMVRRHSEPTKPVA
jgi:K+-sensing histidine kinase KdpD